MIEIRNALIEDPIPGVRFACDISACKGACCTLAGGTGAPLLDEETGQIERAFPRIKSSLSPEHLATIEKSGLFEGGPGSYTTTCVDNRACVFVLYEDGIARCAFEKAFEAGTVKWRKPLSCHLFPIRVLRGASERLWYEHIDECNPALDRGERENIFLSNFLVEPLRRAFGSLWYRDFQHTCDWERKNSAVE